MWFVKPQPLKRWRYPPPTPYRLTQRETRDRHSVPCSLIKEWTQRALALGVSRVMQVWRDMVVRDRLLTDAASTPFLQRHHYETKETGFAQAAAACAGPKGVLASLYLKVTQGTRRRARTPELAGQRARYGDSRSAGGACVLHRFHVKRFERPDLTASEPTPVVELAPPMAMR